MNKATLATQALLDGEAEAMTDPQSGGIGQRGQLGGTAVVSGKAPTPPRKDRPISFALPKIKAAEDLPKVLGPILETVARREITPGGGANFGCDS